jgi:Ni/Co efflux regulator RcnB
MYKSLVTSSFLVVLLIAGCSATPVVTPAPAQPQSDADRNRDRDRDKDRDQDRDRDRDRQTNAPSCPAGEHLFTDKDGRAVCARD